MLLSVDFFLSRVRGEWGGAAFPLNAERACAVLWPHTVRTMRSEPPTDTAGIERRHAAKKGEDAPHTQTHSETLGSLTFDPVRPHACQHHTLPSFCARDRAIICFPPSELNAVMSRHCIGYIVHFMPKVCFSGS